MSPCASRMRNDLKSFRKPELLVGLKYLWRMYALTVQQSNRNQKMYLDKQKGHLIRCVTKRSYLIRQNVLIVLSALHSYVIVTTQLVCHVHSAHETVVTVYTFWTRNLSHTPILCSTLDGGRDSGRRVCGHDIHQPCVSPHRHSQVAPLSNTTLTPFKVTCETYEGSTLHKQIL